MPRYSSKFHCVNGRQGYRVYGTLHFLCFCHSFIILLLLASLDRVFCPRVEGEGVSASSVWSKDGVQVFISHQMWTSKSSKHQWIGCMKGEWWQIGVALVMVSSRFVQALFCQKGSKIGGGQEQLWVHAQSSHVFQILFFLDLFYVEWGHQCVGDRQGHTFL